ncbi:ABC transporter permease [Streptomyces sp. NPDC050732]|uniref:ABC transporter permease n=1 Tax=Streptomyces sp. NPDC050732 TaxID=3154632 RepID=UPI00342F9654
MSLSTLRGPRRVDLRLHRPALWTGGAVLALALVYIGWLRWAANAYPEPADNCYAGKPCDTFLGFSSARELLYTSLEYGSNGLLLLPLLIGVFVAGPVIAREMESGVYKVSWTQSVFPARWLAAKLTTAAVLALGGTLFLMAVFQLGGWDAISFRWNLHWADRGVYEATGPALAAYSLFAVAVGTLVGLVVRRTLLAMAATGIVTGLVLWSLGNVRWHLVPVETITGPATRKGPYPTGYPADSFAMDQGVTNAAGDRFYQGQCLPEPQPGFSCPTDTEVTGWYMEFHPRSHFWYAQLIETGILLALTAAAVYAAFRLLRHRTA